MKLQIRGALSKLNVVKDRSIHTVAQPCRPSNTQVFMGKSYKEPSRAHRAFWQRLLRLLNDPINAAGNAHKMISPIVRVQEIK